MWSGRVAFENDSCPVGDDLLGRLYRADPDGLATLVTSVSADLRAMLAIYCYRRSHLHDLGVAIASSCEERDLVTFGGRAGSMLFALSRQAPTVRPISASQQRRAVTLASAPLTPPPPMADFDDDEDESLAAPLQPEPEQV